MPLFEAGVVTHDCTSVVTSTKTKSPTCVAGTATVAITAPVVGAVLKVTVNSAHALVTGCTSTDPAVFTRFTYRISVARAICPEVIPAGKVERSNFVSAVLPLPTCRFVWFPKLVLACALLIYASPACGASVAPAGSASVAHSSSPKPCRRVSPENRRTENRPSKNRDTRGCMAGLLQRGELAKMANANTHTDFWKGVNAVYVLRIIPRGYF